jgi:hypothetical protein
VSSDLRTGGQNRSCPEKVGTSERVEVSGKGYKRVNIVQKMYTNIGKCKNNTY